MWYFGHLRCIVLITTGVCVLYAARSAVLLCIGISDSGLRSDAEIYYVFAYSSVVPIIEGSPAGLTAEGDFGSR